MIINFSDYKRYDNSMEIREDANVYIITPLSPKLDARESLRLINEVNNENKRISLDLSLVHDCTVDFIEALKNLAKSREIGVFNIPSDIFALFNFMNMDKYVKLFVCETDFEENARQLVNRRFSIL